VPQAIVCFLESHDFESAIRLAVSIGGDSDTIAAITGSLAEAHYGIPEWMKQKAMTYLPADMKGVINKFNERYGKVQHVQVLQG
ncbi:ADP-ribosylglycohydrolase family protein, partial [bacterium]|nr:ADP-ribosylglycohydrolase family protein [bacterium]